jgi:polysaccharide export outer membrane protein
MGRNSSIASALAAMLCLLSVQGVLGGDAVAPVRKKVAPKAAKAVEKKVPAKAEDEVEPEKKKGAYTITVGDVLRVSVWKNPDLDRETSVRPDGKISFPLIDEAQAEGLTISELDKVITAKLKKFIRHPDVSVSFTKMAGRKIVILGEVRNPGVYLVDGPKTILEAIALAGGTTSDASFQDVIVMSGGLEAPSIHKIDLGAALGKGGTGGSFLLNYRDVVYVGSASRAGGRKVSAVLVLGEVRDPGSYEIEGKKTVLEAINMAGGATTDAVLSSVVVIKGGLESRDVRIIDLDKVAKDKKEAEDSILTPYDVLYVPRTRIADAGHFINVLFGSLVRPRDTGGSVPEKPGRSPGRPE